jgi:gamma-glutamyltranspeptidase
VLERLSNNGYQLKKGNCGGSIVQAIEVFQDGTLHAVSDWRKGGEPYGF